MPGAESFLNVIIRAKDEASAVFDQVQSNAQKMSGNLKKVADSVAKGMMVMGGAASAMAGLSIKAAADFETGMTRAFMMFGDVSKEQRENLSNLAKTISLETGKSAIECADALWFLGSAGLKASEAGKALAPIMKMAAATGMEAASAGELAMTSMELFGYQAKDTEKVLDILTGGMRASLITMEDLREAFVYAAPTAAQLGMSLEETTATIAALGKAGVRGSVAGTALARVMEGMLDPGSEASQMFQELGISIWRQDGTMRSVIDIINDIVSATEGMTEEQKTMVSTTIFGTRELRAFNAITQVGTDFINDLTAQLKEGGVVQDMFGEYAATSGAKFAQLKAKLEGLSITLGEKLLPVIEPLINSFSKILEKLSPLIEKHGDLIAKVVLVTSALLPLGVALKGVIGIVGSLSAMIPILGGAFTLLTGPVGIIIGAIAGLITIGILVWKNWDRITVFLSDAWNRIKETAVRVFTALKDFFMEWGWAVAGVLLGPIGALGVYILTHWDEVKQKTIEIWNRIVEFFRGIPSRIGRAFSSLTDYLLSPFRTAINALIRGMNWVIDQLNRISVSIPSWVPGIGGKRFGISLPHIPEWQHGGLITEPTLLYGLRSRRPYAVAGEKGPEWVGPAGSIINNFNIRQMVVRSDDDIYRIAQALHELQLRRSRAVGVR